MSERPKLISEEYRQLNNELHRTRPDYGAQAHRDVGVIARTIKNNGVKSVLDYGCGKGTLKPALLADLPDLTVEEYDPAIPEKSADPKPCQLVVVFDVMEHVEPDSIESVLAHIQSKSTMGAAFVISNVKANKDLPDGRNAHLVVESPDWWVEKVSQYFDVLQVTKMETRCALGCALKTVTS